MSRGMDCIAASSVIAKNGIPHQTLAMIGPQSAWLGLERILSGALRIPSAKSQCGSGPTTGLNNQAQFSPETKLGTAQGRNVRACASARPRKDRLSKIARLKPNANCRTTDATVQINVFFKALQKLSSDIRSRKCARPTK